ncbi:MAG: hypothetical protein RIB48_05615 [Parvibaculum sp.]
MATHEFTRQELYDLVWSIPMAKLAERYGISGNGLAKACRKAEIPVPERGYWAKLQAGKKVVRKALPAVKRDTPRTVIISPPGKREDSTPPPPVPDTVAAKVEQVKQTAKPVSVPATLSNPHRIVAAWLEDERREKRARRGDPWALPLKRSDATELDKRRLRILSALLKAIEASGYTLKCERYRDVQIRTGTMTIELILEERIKQVRRLITDEDRRSSRWYAEGQKWTQEKVPTGRLRLRLLEPEYRHVVKEWEEAESSPLEALLDEVLPTVAGKFEEIRLQRMRQAEEQAKRMEAERLRYEAELEAKKETIRFRRLVAHCANRRTAAEIRELVASVERSPLAADNAELFFDWKSWALSHAERIDLLAKETLFDRERL